jgi:hypothetical protein
VAKVIFSVAFEKIATVYFEPCLLCIPFPYPSYSGNSLVDAVSKLPVL